MVLPSNDQALVSVITPVYNTERYVPQCLDALVRQALSNIELILVNDGSTDGSLQIMQRYAAQDPRIVIIDKPNSGYGASMNVGLSRATGKYIGIVEPDDFPERSMFKRLAHAAEKGDCDLVRCNFYEHRDGRDYRAHNLDGLPYGSVFDPADVPRVACTIPAIWTGLYRRDWLEREGIRFRETPGASFQDAGFGLKTWFAARRCALVRKHLLHYRVDNPDSSSKSSAKVFAVCDELADAESFLRQRPDRAQRFLPWFHVDKWGKYRWNYERIAPEFHLPFATRMYDEYKAARAAGEIDFALFDDRSAQALRQLLEGGAEQFAAAHKDTF